MISTRIGVLSSLKNEEFFNEALSDYSCEVITNFERSLTKQLDYWRNTNTLICVIDDELLKGREDIEDTVLEYFKEVHVPSIRLILFSDNVRDKEDSFFYQLVTTLDIKDIIFTGLVADAKSTLVNKIEHPTLLAEVSHWKTDNKKKLTRKKPGLLSKIKPNKKSKTKTKCKSKKDKEPIIEEDLQEEELDLVQFDEVDKEEIEKTLVMPKLTEEDMVQSGSEEEQEDDFDYFALVKEEENKINNQPQTTEINKEIEPIKEEISVSRNQEDDSTAIEPILVKPSKVTTPAFTLQELLGAIERNDVIPNAKKVIAVGATRHGIGCTHLSVALGSALASKGFTVAVAINERSTYQKMKEALADSQTIELGFRWHDCDFYYWSDEYKYSDKYDYVVCDCGVIDFSDTNKNTPTYRFNTADVKPYIISGAPWDLPHVLNIMQNFPIAEIESWKICFYSMELNTINAIKSGLDSILKSDLEDKCFSIPFRGQLFTVSEDRDFLRYYPIFKDILDEQLQSEYGKQYEEGQKRIYRSKL